MRRQFFLAVAIGVAGLFAATHVKAETKYYWDQSQQKFVAYEMSDLGRYMVGSRASPVPRQEVSYDGPYKAKTIIINTSERRLYYVYADGKAYKYGIGVGREGFTWAGTDRISRKAEWPGWTPPAVMIEREKKRGRILPAHMEGGINNPLGARALYIGSRIYRIHGSNEPWTIGQAVSSGCIRMTNDDVIHLYDQVGIGTRVIVLR
jgi:lipoprotein-anchoring transpeptidase ErfK/SrfK